MSFLKLAVESVRKSLDDGYYDSHPSTTPEKRSLKEQLKKFMVIAEIKPVSPSYGILYFGSAGDLARVYAENGAGAISVLCEPRLFGGSLENLCAAKKTGLPVLAKDFVVNARQLEAYAARGADAVLLISEVFETRLSDEPLEKIVKRAHGLGLEVLLEARSKEAFLNALKSEADIVGVNNRDLHTLKLDTGHYKKVLDGMRLGKPVIAESGFETKAQVEEAKAAGVNGVIVGTALLKNDPAEKLRELA